jgi:transcription antitermination factor NusG
MRAAIASGAPDLFIPGPARWYGLIVAPQREAASVGWLSRRGAYGFYPVRHRIVTRRGKPVRIESRYLPGYVFARFPGWIVWHRVQESPLITDAIRLASGEPATLDPGDLKCIHAMRHRDETEDRARAEAARFRRGDKARIMSGVLAGQEVEIGEIRSGSAVLRIAMFGGEVSATVPLAQLHKIG